MVIKFDADEFSRAIEIAVRNYIEQLVDSELHELNDEHFDMFDYGMMVDRVIAEEIRRRKNVK